MSHMDFLLLLDLHYVIHFPNNMINLLPPGAKKRLTKDFRIRVSIVSFWVVFLFEILTLIFFVPSYYVLSLSTKKLTNELAQRELFIPGEKNDTAIELTAIKKELALLKPTGGEGDNTPTRLLDEILLSKPRGIEINSFSYENVKNKIDIQLLGVASTREDLLGFRKLLSAKTDIAEVKFGSGFITKTTDIEYAMVISFK